MHCSLTSEIQVYVFRFMVGTLSVVSLWSSILRESGAKAVLLTLHNLLAMYFFSRTWDLSTMLLCLAFSEMLLSQGCLRHLAALSLPLTNQNTFPFKGITVEHCTFQGKDAGI